MSSSFKNDKENNANHDAVNTVSRIQPKLKPFIQPKIQSVIQPKLSSDPTSSSKMPEDVQAKMENSFGEDFSDVSIHDNSNKAEELGAKAFAQGKDLHFAPGEFQPNTKEGQELIGHELTHVVQQKEGSVTNGEPLGKDIVNQDPILEKEADDHGKLASEGKTVDVKGTFSGSQVQAKMPDEEYFMHQVLQNESLTDIAFHFNVSTDDVKKLNNLKDEQAPAAGILIKIPAPDGIERAKEKEKLLNPADPTIKPNKKPDPDKNKPDLGLKDQKNQIVKVSVSDFQEFLKLYNAYLASQYGLAGTPANSLDTDAKKLKYLLGPLQNANPQLKQFKYKLEKLIDEDVEKGTEALKAFWDKGWWSKLLVGFTAAQLGAVAGVWVVHSVDLYMEGKTKNNSLGFSPEELTVENVGKLLDNIKFKHKSKDLSGKITDDQVQIDGSYKLGSTKTGVKMTAEEELSVNKKVNDNDWKELQSNGYADKRVWYVPQMKQYMDTMTIRHQLKNKETGLSSVSNIIDASNLDTASGMMIKNPSQTTEVYRVKDGKFYTIANIKTLFDTQVIDKKEVFALKSEIKQVSSEPLITSANLYGDPLATAKLNGESGVGINKGNPNLDYYFKGGFKTSIFGGKLSTTSFATNLGYSRDFNKEAYATPSGLQLEDWVQRRIFELQLSLTQDFRFNTGPVENNIGLTGAYTRKNTITEMPGLDLQKKVDEKISLTPYWNISYQDPMKGKWSIQASPSFFMENNKFGFTINPKLSYSQINKNSVIKIDLETGMQDGTNRFIVKGFNITYFLAFE